MMRNEGIERLKIKVELFLLDIYYHADCAHIDWVRQKMACSTQHLKKS